MLLSQGASQEARVGAADAAGQGGGFWRGVANFLKDMFSDEAAGVWGGPTIRFPGQYYDAETGLHYNRFRYYDPSIGRYISADPIGQAGGVNVYG